MLAYVSYCVSDFEQVKPLLLHLGVLGYSVHFEQKMPVARMRWKHVLASIRDCDVFLLALTENTLKSESRTVEYDYAVRLGKPVLCVQLTDLQTKIPAGYSNVLDYRPGNARRTNELMQTLKTLPRRPAPPADSVVMPDWLASLTRVQNLITVPHPGVAEQDTIIFNVREALERQETALAAELLLELFASRNDIAPQIQPQVQQISKHIKQSYRRQQFIWWRNVAFVGVVALAVMVVATFFLSRRLASASLPPPEVTAEVTQEATAEATAALEADEQPLIFTPVVVPTLVTVDVTVSPAVSELVPPRIFASPAEATAETTPD